MADKFDALDALCAVSIKVNRLDSLEARGEDEDEGDYDSLSAELVATKASFVCKLLEMLNQGDSDTISSGNIDLVRWGREGRTVIIADPSTFSQTMLPRYFKHRNFPSFVRQLNLYGFRKTTQDPSKFEYQHELFVRGREAAMRGIKRKVTPDKGEA
eukprot:CAMPEP_0172161860 /NCGR_PEP_ID=MMETSP1050-20130122/6351_1 /TAXON_ID=233186 /ORGANISM="Cryptomonas curvata, Strain CCAP979/52" /LENGTH=156 /DNA_ID=CAMNT_0012831787 /DNA_START=90 /DNA_END=557 /DNA_ORIENTATION=+